jgi:hypothetical protein
LAERIGVPFRVALPTYGYRLAFDATGKFIGLSAEGVSPILPANGQLRTVRTDASTMAALANKLARARPINCTGIIWFRLPVAGDRLNWDMTTFKVVLRGEIPASDLVTEVVWPSEGLAEVRLINRGERDEFLPAVVFAKWKDEARAQTADGLGGYSFSTDEASPGVIALTASAAAAGQRLAPGRSRTIGWIRFSHEISLIAQITTPP